jgi:aromatic ring-opening dioxygenase catalytic subunit (LigB family)
MSNAPRTPVVFVPHGGGPWSFVDIGFPEEEVMRLARYWESLPTLAPSAKAILVVSAHWEESVPTLMTSPAPPMLYDYYGFPPTSYELTWPAPNDLPLAERVRGMLEEAGFEAAENPERGFDHGTFVPLKRAYPAADVPTLQLSMLRDLDPARHLELGRALAPLRDEGVFIVTSGMSYHNMRGFRRRESRPVAQAFDAWLREATAAPADERDRRLAAWTEAPHAREVHPREEHLLPLMVAAGAAGQDRGTIGFNAEVMGVPVSAVHFG